jgi:dephospho-CoA kinase
MTLIDYDTKTLPDDLTYPLLWLGLLINLNGVFVPLHDAVIGAMAGYLALWSVYWLFKLVTGKEGMGYGDFKLLAALGAWLGWAMLPTIIILSSVVGAVVGISLIVFAKRGRDNPIPFGPYLAAAGMIALLYGPPLTRYAQGMLLEWIMRRDTAMLRYSVGLTGGIGCGKTTVADLFAARGASLVDTDQIAHSLTAPHGAAMPALVEEFGPEFATPDGALDRARMRALVFADPGARTRLEAILHPRIREATAAAALLATGPYTIFVVPLLIESGSWRERVARMLAIDCPEEVQVARVMARNGLTKPRCAPSWRPRSRAAQRLEAADDVVLNDDGLDALLPQVERLHGFYLDEAARLAAQANERL